MLVIEKPEISPELLNHIEVVNKNFKTLLGKPIVPNGNLSGSELFDSIWHGDFVLASHGVQDSPVFNYGNKRALELFEMNFGEFTKLESKYSAEPISREERQILLDKVKAKGYISNYSGTRISSSGKRFCIKKATVFDLVDSKGQYYGQAAMFSNWEDI